MIGLGNLSGYRTLHKKVRCLRDQKVPDKQHGLLTLGWTLLIPVALKKARVSENQNEGKVKADNKQGTAQ